MFALNIYFEQGNEEAIQTGNMKSKVIHGFGLSGQTRCFGEIAGNKI
uniref:Uncharacterized protein n=1 Tax=Anguilla anguilla TaxID=7936 RepID=A0A0E9R785_ANGAN